MVLIVMMIERTLLLAIRRIIGVVHIEDNGGRGLGGTGNEVVHQGAREPIKVFAVDGVLQTGERGGAGSVVCWVQGRPLHSEFAHGVMAEAIGVMGVRIPRGDLIDALGQQVPQGMVNRG
jgi:hypothetical protein